MHPVATAALVAALLGIGPQQAVSEELTLTLERALALARERGPRALSAAARIEEARGRLEGASLLLRENPVLEGGAGRRYADTGDTLEAGVGLHQGFELGGRRRARMAAAEAGIERANAGREEALRRLLREVAAAFYGALHAEESLRLAAAAEDLGAEVARIAERRHRAQDVPILDVNVSHAALSRARSERRVAEAERATSLGELRVLLGMDAAETVRVEGVVRSGLRFTLPELLARADQRADLRALEAKLAEAEAELRLARAETWPDLGLGARYARDERDDIVLGELSVELPIFDRAQGARSEASARARRLRLELGAARRAASVRVEAAFTAHAQRAKAVEELETSALPLLDENESLARRSYEAGEMALAELLVIRGQALGTRREHLQRLLEAALAAVEVEASAGVLE